MARPLLTLVFALAVVPAAFGQSFAYLPDASPTPSGPLPNSIPFAFADCSYFARVPAGTLDPNQPVITDLAFAPSASGTWSAPQVKIGLGHLPTSLLAPFAFPAGASNGDFLDYSEVHDGPLSWNAVQDAWSPMNLGASFVWNGTDDVGVFITFQGNPQSWFSEFHVAGGNLEPARAYAFSYEASQSTGAPVADGGGLRMRLTLAADCSNSEWTLDVPGDYATIQQAVDVACDGWTINVGPGTYLEHDLSFAGKNLTLKSTGGAGVTVIDAQQLGRVFRFQNGEGPGAVLEGFTITGGQADPAGDGGGILILGCSPTIRSCTITGNAAGAGINGATGLPYCDASYVAQTGFIGGPGGDGGGLSIDGGAALIEDCTIENNTAGIGGQGGTGASGVYAYEPGSQQTVSCKGGNGGEGGVGGHGGGIFVASGAPLVRRCLIAGNAAGSGGGGGTGGNGYLPTFLSPTGSSLFGGVGGPGGLGGDGGGIGVDGGTPTFELCRVASGAAGSGGTGGGGGGPLNIIPWNGSPGGIGGPGGHGGGIRVDGGTTTFTNCTVFSNAAGSGGLGGLGSFAGGSTSALNGPNGIGGVGGHGGGMVALAGSLVATNCVVVSNTAGAGGVGYLGVEAPGNSGGIWSTVPSTLRSSIVWSNVPNPIDDGGTLTIEYCTVDSGTPMPGVGNLVADPLFIDLVGGDFHLLPGSPCLEAGDPVASNASATDIDGEPRIQGASVDIGVDEAPAPPLYPGSMEDLVLTTVIDGATVEPFGVVPAPAGAGITLTLSSPLGSLDFTPHLLLADFFATGSPPVGLFPGVYVSAASFVVLIDGVTPNAMLTPALAPAGASLSLLVPPGLAGNSFLAQGVALSPFAQNGGFALTDGVEIQLQ